ncbi:MAG: acyltransferase, partial [Ruminococcaceae bacterium]|nr:acyltransferase [Oscillospiraceae bacterium]
TLFYTISIYAVFLITGGAFSLKGMIESLFPIITCQYWFVSAYVILSLLMPFINKVLNGITQKQFIALLGVLIFYNSVAPTFLNYDAFAYGGHLFYMIMFYCVGAFIRKYPPKKPSKTPAVLLVCISAVLLVLSVVAIDFLAERFTFLAGKSGKFYTVYSVLILTLAIGLLLLFTQMKPRSNKVINICGSCAFGVYLIHENNYMRQWIWGNFCNNSSYAAPLRLVTHMCLCVISVYLICTFIEFIRQYGLEKKLFRKLYVYIYKATNSLQEKLNNIANKIIMK